METKNPAAVALGRLGGKARSRNLTPEERSRIARLGGLARHGLLPTDPDPDPTGTDPSNVRSLADAAKKRGRKLNPPAAAVSASDAGRKGGKARAAKLTRAELSEQGQRAARARWERFRLSSGGRWVAAACRYASANDGHAYPVAA